MYTILGVIAKPLGLLLSFLYGFINDYGITIIVFTIIVKTCLYPLYIKQTKSMARMSEVQPKMAALQRKYANDKETLNIKMAELYKEEKFNPMGGCLPMLIQMPIIMGLFALLRQPMQYMQDDSMLFAVHESFLWIMDLSQPDKWILPILAGVATFISFYFNQQQTDDSGAAAQMNGMMKMMKFIFPVMIVWMGRSFPAGLALYWAIGQFMQIFFNLHLRSVRKKIKEESKKKKRK
ncbi:MAG: membrane protein insertase YidC [Firmicutes bacterium]|jgi:YidC/Oxa1 family membrane protein insertase|nr:membrane protein insertase YidC [Bacillota bacterium]NBI64500.1 protein translocase component YidC [Clostridiales bacterium]